MTSTSSPRRRVFRAADPSVLLLGVLALGLVALPGRAAPVFPGEPDFAAAADRVDPSCVGVVLRDGGEVRERGAGFVLRPGGLVVTAAHVVDRPGEIRVRLADGRETGARLIGLDDLADVALLRIAEEALPVTAAPAGGLRRGDPVAAVGDPLGFSATLTVGHVSATARPWGETSPFDMIQHDAALNPGSSGGPLVDREGRVVAMNLAIADGARRHVGIGLALPMPVVEAVADRLLREGSPMRPRLGARLRGAEALRPAIPSLAAGVVVEAVEPRSPAAEGGLAPGDLVVAADGAPLAGPRDLARALEGKRIGDTLRLTLHEASGGRTATLHLAVAPADLPPAAPVEPVVLGVTVAPGAGSRITAVGAATAAEAAGLGVGDEILAVGDRRTAGEDVAALLAAAETTAGPSGVALLVRRGEATRWLVLGPHGRLDGEAPFGSNAEAFSSHSF